MESKKKLKKMLISLHNSEITYNLAVSIRRIILKQNKMKGLIRIVKELLKSNNVMPTKVVNLSTGIICKHYADGNIKISYE